MREFRHPLSGAVYGLSGDDVIVALGDRVGLYDARGRWISGDRISVCPTMCEWIGNGPRTPVDLSTNRRFRDVMDTGGVS